MSGRIKNLIIVMSRLGHKLHRFNACHRTMDIAGALPIHPLEHWAAVPTYIHVCPDQWH